MRKVPRRLLAIVALAACAASALAQDALRDPMTKLISDMFNMHDGKTLCSDGATSLQKIRADVVEQLRSQGSGETVTAQAVAVALWTRYPCPFSPFRAELRPASAKDVEGVWVFPESDQQYRFGPRSDQPSPGGPLPVRCEAVAYYPDRDLRTVIVASQRECPFRKAADVDIARVNPRVSDWKMLRDGRLSVTRTDVRNHIEEWDIYAVTAPFQVYTMQFEPGDLVAYVRRENGNEVNAATQFRHLKRLQ
jgi:hypothetical protein